MDFLPEITGFKKFITAYQNREVISLNDMEISILSMEDLLTSKITDPRPKDLTDIEMLKSIRDNDSKAQ